MELLLNNLKIKKKSFSSLPNVRRWFRRTKNLLEKWATHSYTVDVQKMLVSATPQGHRGANNGLNFFTIYTIVYVMFEMFILETVFWLKSELSCHNSSGVSSV
jgi:hypothetical protein